MPPVLFFNHGHGLAEDLAVSVMFMAGLNNLKGLFQPT